MVNNVLAFRSYSFHHHNRKHPREDQVIMDQVVVSLTEEGWPLRDALLMVGQVSQIFDEKRLGF